MTSLVGKNISGYQVLEYIGMGNAGSVYKAQHPQIPHPVALKVLRKSLLDNPEAVFRFESEAEVIVSLSEHPNIVPIYDYWRDDDGAYLVLKFLNGGSLRDTLNANGRLEFADLLYILDKLAGVLSHAHERGVVHRDLKPENVLFDEDQNVYLADFGIAKRADIDITHPRAIVGTPGYLAPEQIKKRAITPQTDIYALGIMIYECLTGDRPFDDPRPLRVAMKHLQEPVPLLLHRDPIFQVRMNNIIQKATAKNPAERYAQVQELIADLHMAATVS